MLLLTGEKEINFSGDLRSHMGQVLTVHIDNGDLRSHMGQVSTSHIDNGDLRSHMGQVLTVHICTKH